MSFMHRELLKSIIALGIKEDSEKNIKILGTGVLINFNNFVIITTLKSLIAKLLEFDDFYFFYFSIEGDIKSKKYSEIKDSIGLDWIYHPDEQVDLAVNFFPFDPKVDDIKIIPQKYFFLNRKIEIGTEIYFLSYLKDPFIPNSVIPISRRGFISGKSKDMNYLLEMIVHEEDVGSPVFALPTFMTTSGRMIQTQSNIPRLIGFINYGLNNNSDISLNLSPLISISYLAEIFSSDQFLKIIENLNKPYLIEFNDIIRDIKSFLENYELHSKVDEEPNDVYQFYNIFIKNRILFLKMGFNYKHNDDSIQDSKFWIHFTKRNDRANQFLIRKLKDGEIKIPDDVYFSKLYPQEMRKKNNKEIFVDFINYLEKFLRESSKYKHIEYQGFNYLSSTLKRFKPELNEKISNLPVLNKRELPLILKSYDLVKFLNLDFFSLKNLCIKKKEVTAEEFSYIRFEIKKKKSSRKRYPIYENLNFYLSTNYERVGFREILAPKADLKRIQEKIYNEILSKVNASDFAHGFIKGRSIVSNASKHIGANIIYNIDLKNFFPSIKFDKVLKLFKSIGYSGLISSLLASICTFAPRYYKSSIKKWVLIKSQLPYLPQGACTSPAISNLVCTDLDEELNEIGKQNEFIFTRYADDITFSSKTKDNITKDFRNRIFNCIKKHGFTVNEQKEKFSFNQSRMVVTGLIVHTNELSIPRKWIKNLRAALHQLRNNKYNINDPLFFENLKNIEGRCAYAIMVNKARYSHFFHEFHYLKNLKFKSSK